MRQYSLEEVKQLFENVVANVEFDLVHHIKHSKTHYEDHVNQLRVLDRLVSGFQHQLTEELN
jgi:hypothetical protein